MSEQQLNPADAEILRLATESDDPPADDTPPADDDTLELGGEDAPKVEGKPEGEDEKGEKKRNHRPWNQRVDILTARLRDAEQRAAAAEAKLTPPPANDDPAPDPNDAKYEFGEADPQFIRDYAAHAAREAIREERAKAAEADKAVQAQNETVGKVREGIAKIEADIAEKYPDFQEKIAEAMEARGGEPLPAVTTIALSQSPVGGDVLYRLATDSEAQSRIDKAVDAGMRQIEAMRAAGQQPDARVFANAAAEFGKIEGEYLDDDSDLDLSDPLDMARAYGRMQSRIAGKKAPAPAERKTTKAPPPPETRARGGNGQFEVDDATEDFAAFERKYMGKR